MVEIFAYTDGACSGNPGPGGWGVQLVARAGGRVLAESNAILCWLGEGTDWMPADPFARAEMLAWMFWEQNQHEGTVAVRAALRTYPQRPPQATPERLAALLEQGHRLLGQMEQALTDRPFLTGDAPSLADIALYAYTHSADTRGGFDLTGFPAIRGWLARIAALPGHITLDHLP